MYRLLIYLLAWSILNGAGSLQGEEHWAYLSPKRSEVPKVRQGDWCRSPIDAFILARLEANGLRPNPRADSAVLLRRIYLDLIGLTPTVEELDAFLSKASPDALAREVDRLLASPRFGEKWARHWLDLARYADSEGYQRDELREIWPYRDWVINAFNRDLPYDQFSVEQLAGDLLPAPSVEQLVATGFHRNTPVNLEAGTDPAADRHKQLIDRVATTGTVWLGTTLACAQCHDHKYDPVSIEEYYGFLAFFNQSPIETRQRGDGMGNAGMVYIGPDVTLPLDPDKQTRREHWETVTQQLNVELRQFVTPVWAQATENLADSVNPDPELLKTLEIKPAKRQDEHYRTIGEALVAEDARFREIVAALDRSSKQLARYPVGRSRIMREQATRRRTHVMRRGDREALGREVLPTTPAHWHPFSDSLPRDRLGLARWLVSRDNPLVARVAVNRIWAELMGFGLVRTPDDFGQQGDRPTHPGLLDWLAVTFATDDDWSMKHLIKRIVLSAVYQQGTSERSDGLRLDPGNQLWWRHPGHRLAAETIRDLFLNMAGILSERMGGTPAYPWQPDGVWRKSAGAGPMHYDVANGEEGFRRGIYTVWRRSAHYPSFAAFDAPDRGACVVARDRSNTPLQALALMNDRVYVEAAGAFAKRILEQPSESVSERLVWAFRTLLARRPTPAEEALLYRLYENERQITDSEADASFSVATVLMNLHETICRN